MAKHGPLSLAFHIPLRPVMSCKTLSCRFRQIWLMRWIRHVFNINWRVLVFVCNINTILNLHCEALWKFYFYSKSICFNWQCVILLYKMSIQSMTSSPPSPLALGSNCVSFFSSSKIIPYFLTNVYSAFSYIHYLADDFNTSYFCLPVACFCCIKTDLPCHSL